MKQTINDFRKLFRINEIRLLVFCGLMVCFDSLTAIGSEAASGQNFEVSEGNAIETLQEAARQAQVEIFYSAAVVRGIRTLSIKGEYVPLEAFRRMLQGTSLTVFQHGESGVYSVKKSENENSNPNNKNDMNNSPSQKQKGFLKAIFGTLVALNAGSAHAQDDVIAEEELYELSPFVVETDEDSGYMATSTLAGTRLKTNLKDVGSAISVMTDEFFEDTGSTDASSILAYGLNTEVSGVQGNFANVQSGANGRVSSESNRTNSQGGQRIRGLAQASLTRNYFLTNIPFDSYNTSAITINRGPNSLLFGIGTPGGVIDNATNQAVIGNEFGELSIRIGERESHRESFDYNRDIISNRLAVRIAGLNERTNYQQEPAYEDDRRVYAAIKAVLFENEKSNFLDQTRIRANFESGSIKGTPPDTVPFTDGVSSWFALPDNYQEISDLVGVAPSGFVEGYNPKWTVNNYNADMNESTLEANFGPMDLPFFINMPYVYTDASSLAPSVGLADPSIQGVQARIRWSASRDPLIPDWLGSQSNLYRTEHYFGNNRAGPVRAPGFANPVIMDRGIYDNTKTLLSGTINQRHQEFDVTSFALEQTFFGGKAGLEMAFDQQRYENYTYFPFATDVVVDVNEYLSNGQANPNLGRAYIMDIGFDNNHDYNQTRREAMNVTAFVQHDFTDSDTAWMKWLGRHTVTGFMGKQTIDSRRISKNMAFIDIEGTDVASHMRGSLDGFRRRIPTIAYLTPSLLGNEYQTFSDVSINQTFSGRMPQDGDISRQAYNQWNPVWGGSETDRLLVNNFEVDEFLISGGRSRQEIESKVLSWQSHFLGDSIVGLVGWRSDKSTSTPGLSTSEYNAMGFEGNNQRLADGAWDPAGIILTDDDARINEQEGDTLTWSIVAHVPETWLKLPYNSTLSFHYNESENFSASGTRRNFLGDVLPAPSGVTTEYGGTLNAFNGKLNIRVNFFETNNSYATLSNSDIGGGPDWISNGLQRYRDMAAGRPEQLSETEWLQETLGMSVLAPEAMDYFTSWDQVYDEMLAVLPDYVQDRFLGFDPDSSQALWEPNPGEAVTQDFVAEGVEIDIVGNITDSWTVALNIGQQKTETSNTAPVAYDHVFEIWDNLQNSILFNMIDSPIQGEATTFGQRWLANQVNPAVAARAKDGTVSLEQREWRANLVTNYLFRDGTLEGLGIGGALRWQSEVATGYEIEVVDGLVNPKIDRPFMGEDELNGDIWISYKRQIRDGIDWKIQLNIRNAIGTDDYIPVITNPDGRVAVVRNPNPQEIFLTNTFSF